MPHDPRGKARENERALNGAAAARESSGHKK
jgi:hypothetical protein